MKIVKFKKMGTGKYKVTFEDGLNIYLHEDIIVKYNLLSHKEMDLNALEEIQKDNNNYMAYDTALKYIKVKMRCEKEIIEYLKKKNIDDNLINSIVLKLKEQGYLNKSLYIDSYISDKINLCNIGPIKIKNDLLKLGFNEEEINIGLDKINYIELNQKLEKMINKKINQNKNYSGNILKQRIIVYFTQKGFYKEDIEEILNKSNLNDKNKLEVEYNKLYKKYSKKYSGIELENIIKQKLFQKGFSYNTN